MSAAVSVRPRQAFTHRLAMLLNPYVANGPVGDTPAFIGRSDVLGEVMQVLQRRQAGAVVLYGQRRIGKTSILQHMAYWLPRAGPYSAIYFDLQDKASWPVGRVLQDLAGAVARSLGQPEPALGPEPEITFRQTWLPAVLASLAGDLMMLFDESGAPAASQAQDSAGALFAYLRGLLADYRQLQLVFAIGRSPGDVTRITGSLFDGMPARCVSLLSQKEAMGLVRLAEKNDTLAWPADAMECVWRLARGHPLLTQRLCFHVWQQVHKDGLGGRPAVTPADVEAAVPQALKAGHGAMEWWWGGLPPAGQIIVSALAQAGPGPVKQKELERLLRHNNNALALEAGTFRLLQDLDIIRPVNSSYEFRVELLRRWVAEHKPWPCRLAQAQMASGRRFRIESLRRWAAEHRPAYRAPGDAASAQPEAVAGRQSVTGAPQKPFRLSAWSPLDYVRLLWWTLMTPQHLRAYREVFGEDDECRLGRWLGSTLVWLPLFIPALALGLGLLPRQEIGYPPVVYLGLAAGLALVWLLSSWFDLGNHRAVGPSIFAAASIAAVVAASSVTTGSASGLVIGVIGILAITVAAAVTNVVMGAMAGDVAVGVAGGVASGAVFGMAFGLTGSVAGGIAVGVAVSVAMSLLDDLPDDTIKFMVFAALSLVLGGITGSVMGSLEFDSLPGVTSSLVGGAGLGMTGAAAFVTVIFVAACVAGDVTSSIENSMKVNRPAWLARSAFVILLWAHAVLVWFSFLNGWRILG